ncbi:MAG: hypothetical protein GTO18_09070 [Anaerolineales bacterium]|nr:hypothetical protein [Anaerolineales bacterium]
MSDEDLERLMNMYLFNKHLFKSVDVDFTFEEVGMRIGPLLLIHVPGHCPGQIVIQADDILFSSDHILGKTTPHQAPEQITLNTGLGHYLESLDKVMPLSSKVNLTLGGHEDPIPDLRIRIDEIKRHHEVRLAEILDHLNNPMTISELSYELFHETEGYNEILALQETGSHVEYLAQRGYLAVDNLDDMQPDVSVPIHYRYSDGVKPPRIT